MRGSCSPLSMSTTRVAPMRLRIVTRPGLPSLAVPMIHAWAPSGCARICSQRPLRFARGNEADESAFVGDVQRIESQDLAGALDVLQHGNGAFLDFEVKARGFGDFNQRAGEASAREIPQAVHFDLRFDQIQDDSGKRRAIAFDGALEFKPFAHGHDRDSVAPDISAQDDGVPRLHICRRDGMA